MKIQIVDPDTSEVIFVPSANQHLEVELHALFDRGFGWWRPLARRKYRQFCAEVDRATGELRELTRQV